jgi:hypothetical protein
LLLPLAEEPPSSGGDLGNLRGLIAHKVFRRGAGEYLHDEIRRHIGDLAAENRVGIPQKLSSSVFILENVNRRVEALHLARTTSPGIDIHGTTSLIRGADCSGNRFSERSFRR